MSRLLADVTRTAIKPALALLPPRMDSNRARCMLLAIGLQESRLTYRRQIGGPARGLWQFERDGGVVGVLSHPASAGHAANICEARGIRAHASAVYPALEHDDVLAAAFARLLLWTDPKALPQIGDEEGAWQTYIWNWRPGRPHRHTWGNLYAQAVAAVDR